MYDGHPCDSLIFWCFFELGSIYIEGVEMSSHGRDMCDEEVEFVRFSAVLEEFIESENIQNEISIKNS